MSVIIKSRWCRRPSGFLISEAFTKIDSTKRKVIFALQTKDMMQTDELIRNAMKGGGGMLDGKSFFVVEGNVEKNEFRVLSLQEAYIENYVSFVFQIDHRFIMLGIFNTAEAADEFIQMVRTIGRDEAGNRIG